MAQSLVAPLAPLEQEQEYDRVVREDIGIFADYIAKLQAGEINDEQFRQHRLRRGIYGQRQPGVQMIRTKIPGGIATARQIERLAQIADRYAAGKAHLTTRQNVQYHFVPLAQVPALLHELADVRLTTREACYNTVRNITACPLTGLIAEEAFFVNPYARRLAFAFLHKDITDNLPRKFKIAFCGCKDDCMLGAIHDVGLRPVIREEQGVPRRGFRMVVGGGLGPLPQEAAVLDEFVPEEQLVHKCEAMIRVFSKYGNRQNRNKARFKFILRERGFDWVKEAVEREFQDILQNGGIPMPEEVPEGFGGFESQPSPLGNGGLLPILSEPAPADAGFEAWLATNVREQKQPGLSAVTVRVDQGNLTGDQLRGLAQVARSAGDGQVRFTIRQNLILANVPVAHLRRVYAALQSLSLAEAFANEAEDVTTCPGAYSCNLALTKSMNLGSALADELKTYGAPAVRRLRIHVSGCPNACGQHWIGDIGFYGNARKVEGKEVPYYQMLLGGGYDGSGVMRFGMAIQSLPAKLAPEAVRRVLAHFQQNGSDQESFREYVLRHRVETFRELTRDLAKPAAYNPELFKDWGDDTNFSLQLGRGECAS